MNSRWQTSLCLIGMIILMHNSECSIEPLAWGGIGVMAGHIALLPSFWVVFWMHMIIKKKFTTPPWVQFTQLLQHSGDVKVRGLDNPYYFPFTLYSLDQFYCTSAFKKIIYLLNKKHVQLLFFVLMHAAVSWVMSSCIHTCEGGKGRLGRNQSF